MATERKILKITKEEAETILDAINDLAGEGLMSKELQELGIKLKLWFFPSRKEEWWEKSKDSDEEYEAKKQKIMEELKKQKPCYCRKINTALNKVDAYVKEIKLSRQSLYQDQWLLMSLDSLLYAAIYKIERARFTANNNKKLDDLLDAINYLRFSAAKLLLSREETPGK